MDCQTFYWDKSLRRVNMTLSDVSTVMSIEYCNALLLMAVYNGVFFLKIDYIMEF